MFSKKYSAVRSFEIKSAAKTSRSNGTVNMFIQYILFCVD